jgi:hypothetical protein
VNAKPNRATLALIAALWATVVGLYLLIAATYDRSVAFITPNPPVYEVVREKLLNYASVVAVPGFDSASGLFIPTLLALCPLAIRKYRRAALLVAGALTLGVCLVWPFSIGVLYLPTAMLLLFAVVRPNADPAHAIDR